MYFPCSIKLKCLLGANTASKANAQTARLQLWQNKAAVVYGFKIYIWLIYLFPHKCGRTSKQSYNRTNRFAADSGLPRPHDMPGCASACHIINNISLRSRQRDQHFPSSCVSIWTFMRLHITAWGTINLIAYIFFPLMLWQAVKFWNECDALKGEDSSLWINAFSTLLLFFSECCPQELFVGIQEPSSPVSFSGRRLQHKTLVTVYTDLIIIKANWVNGMFLMKSSLRVLKITFEDIIYSCQRRGLVVNSHATIWCGAHVENQSLSCFS